MIQITTTETLSLSNLKVLTLSDLHVNVARLGAKFSTWSLQEYFRVNDSIISSMDGIILAGDVYDRLLIHPSNETVYIMEWIISLFKYCKDNNLFLRVLEGTKSHDWGQSKDFVIVSRMFKMVDFAYYDTVVIERMEKYDTTVLYIPDEWSSTCDKTWDYVLNMMNEQHISEVDIAVMHGAFEYQLDFPGVDVHVLERYERIVKYYICIGHIHTSIVKGKSYPNGSFLRFAFNEPNPKGGWIHVIEDGVHKPTFLENENATQFVKVEILLEYSTRVSKAKINKAVKKLPNGSFVAIVLNRKSAFMSELSSLKDQYPNITFTRELVGGVDEEVVAVKEYSVFNITEDNLLSTYGDFVEDNPLKDDLVDLLKTLL